MNRPLVLAGMWLLSGAIMRGAAADHSMPQKSVDYTILLKQLRLAEKLPSADLVQYHAISDIVQGDDFPTAMREAAKRKDDTALMEFYEARNDYLHGKVVKGTSLLSHACINGDADIVKLLLARGADVKAVNEEGWTALHHAADAGKAEILKILLDKKADVNARSTRELATPLMIAAGRFRGAPHDSESCVRLLLARGAHINAQTNDGETALMYAAHEGRVATVRLLLDEGADATQTDNKHKSALARVAEFATMDEYGKVTVTQDSTIMPVYKIELMDALIRHGKAMPGRYEPGVEAKVQQDGLNDFLTIIRLLRAARATL